MNQLFNKFLPQDIIAIVIITGGLILKLSGINGVVGQILIMVVIFYFGKKEILDKITEKHLPEAKSETVEETIKRIAKDEGIDPCLTLRVARCESGLNPAAKNINTNGSVDRGLFQWNNRWHPEITDEVAFDIEKSTRAFCRAFKDGHLNWWDASKHCWSI